MEADCPLASSKPAQAIRLLSIVDAIISQHELACYLSPPRTDRPSSVMLLHLSWTLLLSCSPRLLYLNDSRTLQRAQSGLAISQAVII